MKENRKCINLSWTQKSLSAVAFLVTRRRQNSAAPWSFIRHKMLINRSSMKSQHPPVWHRGASHICCPTLGPEPQPVGYMHGPQSQRCYHGSLVPSTLRCLAFIYLPPHSYWVLLRGDIACGMGSASESIQEWPTERQVLRGRRDSEMKRRQTH